MPNILKEFNPNLRGYSTGTGEWLERNARLNVAFPVASDQDAFKQAKVEKELVLFLPTSFWFINWLNRIARSNP